MVRVLSPVRVAVVTALALGAVVTAFAPVPQAVGQVGQIRDPASASAPPQRDPAQPTVRRIPVDYATVSGTAVAADTGRPVRNARVTLNGTAGFGAARAGGAPGLVGFGTPGGATGASAAGIAGSRGVGAVQVTNVVVQLGVSRTTTTDAQGQFSFQRLPSGQFTLNVNHSQFLATSYGQRRPGGQGTAIQLVDGQQVSVKIPMVTGGVITGMVCPGKTARRFATRRSVRGGTRW